ncbi:dTMP kinase [bacterium]|nr:dTMP kinase [bacterium]
MPQLNRGIFIVLEGIDGAGKTTQLDLLRQNLEDRGFSVVLSKEPTNGTWGQHIRKLYVNDERMKVTADEEAELFVRDRAEDVALTIQPALDQKKIVIVDRYFYSNLAYQGARGASMDLIREHNACFPVPDLVFLIDLDPQLGTFRIQKYRDESTNAFEKYEELQKVRQIFNTLPDRNIIKITGNKSIEDIQHTILELALDYISQIVL